MSLEEKENRSDLSDVLIAFQPESSDFFVNPLAGLLAFHSLTPSPPPIVIGIGEWLKISATL